jgi:integrase
LGDKPIGAITDDDLEAMVQALRTKGRATSTRNQYVQLLKKSFRWAMKKGYVTRNPTISDDSTLTRGKVAKRHRRFAPDVVDDKGRLVVPGEERRLLAVAGVRLQNLIIAALETACRRGELLALTWADVNLERKELTVRAETAKDDDRRVLPISPRLAAVLEMAKTDPAGKEYEAGHFVFGEVGQQVTNVKRAWETAVLRAHGHTPGWQTSSLAPPSRAALRAIDLHFHDLRHEGASRMLEAGWPLHHIQHMLGHASLEQTSTYLNVEKTGLQDSMKRFGVPAGIRCNSVASEASKTASTATDTVTADSGNTLIN